MAGVFVAYICDDVFHRLFCFCEEMGSLKQTSFLEILAECVRRIFLHEAADIIVRLMAGNRPSFIEAGAPDKAEALYEYIIRECRKSVPNVRTGQFGAEMQVSLVNDGPFTILLDSETL